MGSHLLERMRNMIKLLFLTLHTVLAAFNPFEETCPGRRQCLYDYETQKWVDRRGPLTSNSNPLYTTTGIARISRLQKRDFPKCECSSYTRKNTGGSTEGDCQSKFKGFFWFTWTRKVVTLAEIVHILKVHDNIG